MARARSNNRAGPARQFGKMLKRLLKMRFLKRGERVFGYKEKIKIVAEVPLISQNQNHRMADRSVTLSVAHSCWAYARVIALYHSGKFGAYKNEEKSYGTTWTAWQVAEEMFWKQVKAGRVTSKKKDQYEGDHAFSPKEQCPNSVLKASPKTIIEMGPDIICEVIEGLMKDSIYILGLGTCGDTTDHYSNVIGFTSNIPKAATTFTTDKCVAAQFDADTKKVKTLGGEEKAKLEKKILQHQGYQKSKPGDTAHTTTYTGAGNIFESSCHWKEYCQTNLESVKTSIHLIIMEPWCTKEIGGDKWTKGEFYKKEGWANTNCVTGADNKIKKGPEQGDQNAPDPTCAKAGKDIILHWECIKEVPFEIHPAETKGKPWDTNCMNKNMLTFTNDKKDVIRGAEACVLGDTGNHWGYAQYLWEVPAR